MQAALQRYLDNNRMYNFEGNRGIDRMEKVMNEVCGYGAYNTSVAFFEDNPGAIEAVIEWIGRQNCTDWKDNLESLVGPDEEEEVGDLAPPEETPDFSIAIQAEGALRQPLLDYVALQNRGNVNK
jgi:hypothetical protein